MIEVVYKDGKKTEGALEEVIQTPKNIRQIGNPKEHYRIYIEDYVYTYLLEKVNRKKQQSEKDADKIYTLAVLLGNYKWNDENTFLFISGALEVKMEELNEEHIVFEEETWRNIQKEKDLYFPEEEIIGWFFGDAQIEEELPQIFSNVHIKEFGENKILMLMDSSEKEDAFFCLKNGKMQRQKGYYIYYEKNENMQTYMIEKKTQQPEQMETVPDQAVKKIRKIIRDKNMTEEPEREEGASVFSFVVTACLALAVLGIGLNYYREYRNIDQNITKTTLVADSTKVTITPGGEKEVLEKDENIEVEEDKSEKETESMENTSVWDTELEKLEEEGASQADVQENETPAEEDQAGELEETISQNTTYVIKPGDTLYQISVVQCGGSQAIEEICKLNNISQDEIIYPGQVIVLP